MSQTKWLTQDSDIKIAKAIMTKYIDFNDGEPISFFEVNMNEQETLDIKISAWIVEIAHFFQKEYGKNQGWFVTQQIIGHCFTEGNTIH